MMLKYVTADTLKMEKVFLSDAVYKGNATRRTVMYTYKDGSKAPLVISSGVDIKFPKGSTPEMYNRVITGRTNIAAKLENSDEKQYRIYEVLCGIHERICKETKLDAENVYFPISVSEDNTSAVIYFKFKENKNKVLYSKIYRNGKEIALPLQPCMATVGFEISFPVNDNKIHVQFAISQMIIGEYIPLYTLGDDSFNG